MNYKYKDIAIIMTIYKRSRYNEQFVAILNQKILPKEIFVWQNESHVDYNPAIEITEKFKKLNININHIHSKNKNFKFHGRFTLPLLIENKYVVILDDDTIPGNLWFEKCLNLCNENNAIITANGRKWDFKIEKQIGFEAPVKHDMQVDFGGHCWFFKREHIHHMWREKAPTFENGEDMHMSAAAKIHGNIITIMPQQIKNNRSDWGDKTPEFGWDEYASWRKPNHGNERDDIFKYWIEKGWKPIKEEQ
jgi:hypothetical protein